MNESQSSPVSRREFMRGGLRIGAVATLGALGGVMATRSSADDYLWQIDPQKCSQCGHCATDCVLEVSAVKCVQNFSICGYCDLCTGYFEAEPIALNTGAENQLCPTGAIIRKFVEDPYFEYTIAEDLCIGCAKCVRGCAMFGNGSFHLQIRHDRCVNCNECAISRVCPSDAFIRVPRKKPNIERVIAH
jgi:Na+-translocating ferredoxin:NAD+ oxidoreductase subunit B